MKPLFLRSVSVIQVQATLTVLIAAFMPLSKKAMPLLIALWVMASFFVMRRSAITKASKTLIWPMVYYGCVLLWVIPSLNKEMAYFALEVKFSLLLFPLVFVFMPIINQRSRLHVLLALVWGCISMVLIALIRAAVHYVQTGETGGFFYDELAWFFHPTYLATYDAFALIVLLRMHVKKVFALGSPLLHFMLSALLIVHVALLESKAGYLCVLLALVLGAFMLIQRNRTLKGVLYALLGAGLLTIVVLAVPTAKNRLSDALVSGETLGQIMDESNERPLADPEGSTVGRLSAWKASVELILTHPFGVGTGDVGDELNSLYLRDHQSYALRKSLNPHNQFLQAGVAFGWTGIAVLVVMFLSALRFAFRQHDFIYVSFLLLLLLNMMFESFLEVQSGVVFFAFFYSFFTKNPSHAV